MAGVSASIGVRLPAILDRLSRRLRKSTATPAQPVNVIGISLGGLLARDLAHETPERIRHVLTIAAPVRLPTATRLRAALPRADPLL